MVGLGKFAEMKVYFSIVKSEPLSKWIGYGDQNFLQIIQSHGVFLSIIDRPELPTPKLWQKMAILFDYRHKNYKKRELK